MSASQKQLSDAEKIRRCALAMGLRPLRPEEVRNAVDHVRPDDEVWIQTNEPKPVPVAIYDPLTREDQAKALAERFGLKTTDRREIVDWVAANAAV
jgi:hypothetical protein